MNKLMTQWRQALARWPELTLYQQFESVVALTLNLVINVVIVIALFRLIRIVVTGPILGALDPIEPKPFQTVFAEILTVMIALEFNHTLHYAAGRDQSVIQTRVVLMIAILALARKFVVMDFGETSGGQLVGLAAVTLALAVTYWLMGRHGPLPPAQPEDPEDAHQP